VVALLVHDEFLPNRIEFFLTRVELSAKRVSFGRKLINFLVVVSRYLNKSVLREIYNFLRSVQAQECQLRAEIESM